MPRKRTKKCDKFFFMNDKISVKIYNEFSIYISNDLNITLLSYTHLLYKLSQPPEIRKSTLLGSKNKKKNHVQICAVVFVDIMVNSNYFC